MLYDIVVERLPGTSDIPIPKRATVGSAGFDLYAAVDRDNPVILEPGRRLAVPSGIKLMFPQQIEAQIRPRSGLALKYGITVLNAPGTIDSDYRGEIYSILINLGNEPFRIERRARVAQIVFAMLPEVRLTKGELDNTFRDECGFGSTG